MNKFKDFLNGYWPEYVPSIGMLVISFVVFRFFPDISISTQAVKDVNSLVAQILGGLLGLFLASYTVLYGINFKNIVTRISDQKTKEEVKVEATKIFDIFFQTIKFSSIYLVVSTINFLFASLSVENGRLFQSEFSGFWNLIFILMPVCFLISSILSLIGSINVLVDLRDL